MTRYVFAVEDLHLLLLAGLPAHCHRPEKYTIIQEFIAAVKAYTGKNEVDLVTHSLGSPLTKSVRLDSLAVWLRRDSYRWRLVGSGLGSRT